MEESMSPLPVKDEMDFPTAIKKIIEGEKIYRLEWKNKEFYGELKDGILKLHKPDGKFYAWTINDGDLNGEDWITL